MIAVGDNVQVVRSSGKTEWGWTVEKILTGYAPLGIHSTAVVIAEYEGQKVRKEVPLRTLVDWQTYAVCDLHENLVTVQKPSTL